jgi:hypothetical protein
MNLNHIALFAFSLSLTHTQTDKGKEQTKSHKARKLCEEEKAQPWELRWRLTHRQVLPLPSATIVFFF